MMRWLIGGIVGLLVVFVAAVIIDAHAAAPTTGAKAALAITDFRKAIELDGNNAEAWLWLGLGLRKENNEAEAHKAFTRSLQLNPNRVWAKQQLEKTPPK